MFISSCVSSTENLIVSSICYNRSHFISKLMLMAIFVIISSFDENSVCFIFAFAVKVMMLMPSAWYFRNAWCFLWDSAEYLCLLHHTKLPQSYFFLFFIFFVLPHRWYRQLKFVAFLHNSAIPFHHHLEKEKFHSLVSGVFRLSMVMKNDFVLYNLCSNLFTIFAVDVKRTSARAYELLNLHDDDDEEFRLEISFYERHNEKKFIILANEVEGNRHGNETLGSRLIANAKSYEENLFLLNAQLNSNFIPTCADLWLSKYIIFAFANDKHFTRTVRSSTNTARNLFRRDAA